MQLSFHLILEGVGNFPGDFPWEVKSWNFREFCLNSSKRIAYNSEPFLWDTHKAILGLVAYFG